METKGKQHAEHDDFMVPVEEDQRWCVHKDLVPLLVPISEIDFDAANARLHGPRNIAAIGNSYENFGQRKTIVLQKKGDRYICRAGNGSLTAIVERGWTHVAAVRISESDVRATSFAIADNRTAELAEWEHDVLAQHLENLREEDDELFDLTGFTDYELEVFSGDWSEDSVNPDEIEEYDEEEDTCVVKIKDVLQSDGEKILELVNDALKEWGYNAEIYR